MKVWRAQEIEAAEKRERERLTARIGKQTRFSDAAARAYIPAMLREEAAFEVGVGHHALALLLRAAASEIEYLRQSRADREAK